MRYTGVNIGTGGPFSLGLNTTFTFCPMLDRVEVAVDDVGHHRDAFVERHVGDARRASGARRMTL